MNPLDPKAQPEEDEPTMKATKAIRAYLADAGRKGGSSPKNFSKAELAKRRKRALAMVKARVKAKKKSHV